jgi:hypothetical protein
VDAGLATVVAASIAGFASIVGILLKFRKENHADHGQVMTVLQRIDAKVDKVGDRVTGHIDWHLKEGSHGRSVEGNQD